MRRARWHAGAAEAEMLVDAVKLRNRMLRPAARESVPTAGGAEPSARRAVDRSARAARQHAFFVARARRLAEKMGIAHGLARRPRGLSQGERQRVAICRALVTEPALIMCDEPTGNLDPRTAGSTLDLLFERVAERGATLLMVTHNHGILDRFDRVVDINDMGAPAA